MNISSLYRRRLIPAECILLKDDVIVEQNDEYLVTKWTTLRPKPDFSHGCSCYFFREGLKVSKIYRADSSLLYWYCDVAAFSHNAAEQSLTVTDLLADVILYPDGRVQVVDLDELAEALERGLLTKEQMSSCLRSLNYLLSLIYRDKFDRLQAPLNRLEL
ncbi:MAG: DUF402 domain-containing protein [Roseburia sp.]|nr:DUF402 domain-containing protein [Roseburia sp.]MCM1099188.1 DUF402 domain-containing protein [Ruminococcus flavefaciens]